MKLNRTQIILFLIGSLLLFAIAIKDLFFGRLRVSSAQILTILVIKWVGVYFTRDKTNPN
jgi:hypothetical protein